MLPTVIQSEHEIAEVMARRRKELGLSQLALDDRAGLHLGYTGKLELQPEPGQPRGAARRAIRIYETWDWWSGALDVDLFLVPKEHAAAFRALEPGPAMILAAPVGVPSVRR